MSTYSMRISKFGLGDCKGRFDKGVASQFPVIDSALVQCLAMLYLEAVSGKVSIEATHGVTEIPVPP
jgi:hypothetical protein